MGSRPVGASAALRARRPGALFFATKPSQYCSCSKCQCWLGAAWVELQQRPFRAAVCNPFSTISCPTPLSFSQANDVQLLIWYGHVLPLPNNLCAISSLALVRVPQLEIEPGRYLVAESGALLTELRAVKDMGPENTFYLVDAGFNNLARPIMYGAYHPIAV